MQYAILLHSIFTVHKQFEGCSAVFSEIAGTGHSKTQKTKYMEHFATGTANSTVHYCNEISVIRLVSLKTRVNNTYWNPTILV